MWHSGGRYPLEDPMKKRWWITGAAVVVVAAAVTLVVWPDRPTDDECREMFIDALSGGDFPETCTEWLESGITDVEQQGEAILACHDAVVETHAQQWDVELQFTSSHTEESPAGGLRVTGGAEGINRLGQTLQWSYACTVSEDGSVLQADTNRL